MEASCMRRLIHVWGVSFRYFLPTSSSVLLPATSSLQIVCSMHHLQAGTAYFLGGNKIAHMLRDKKHYLLLGRKTQQNQRAWIHSTLYSKCKPWISACEGNQIWFMASCIDLAVFQPGGFACSPCTQEVYGSGGDPPMFPTAASVFTNNFPGNAGHTWKF